MSIQLTFIDLSVIAVYAVFIIALGLMLARKHQNAEDYFLAGRSMTWPLIGLSLFASNISSTTLVALPFITMNGWQPPVCPPFS